MEVVVGEALGHVRLGDACRRLELAQVEDELVRAQALLAGEEHLVGAREARGHVVGVEDGHLREEETGWLVGGVIDTILILYIYI